MLNARAIQNGALLLSLGTGLAAVIKFMSVPILARLLTPTEFGVAGSALVLVSFATILSGGTGLGTAVTYFKDRRHEYDHVVVWTAVLIGVTFGALVWAFSEILAQVAGGGDSGRHIRTVALFFPFSVLSGVGYALLARDLQFRSISAINIAASVLSTLTAILMAFEGMGAASLIWQYCVFNILKCIGFVVASGYHPKLYITSRGIRDIFPFAYRLTLAEMLTWISSEGPFVLITWMFGVALGGVYRVFQRLTALPREIFGENIARAAYVGMANSTNDGAVIGFLWFTKFTTYIQGAVFLWLAAMAEPITALFLGSQYATYWPLAVALSIGFTAQSLSSMTMPFLKARGRTGLVLFLSTLRTIMILSGAWLGLQWTGALIGMAIAIALSMIIASLIFLVFISTLEQLCFRRLAAATLRPLLLVVLTGSLVHGLDQQIASQVSNVSRVILGTVLGASLYALLIRGFAPQDFNTLISSLPRSVKNGRA